MTNGNRSPAMTRILVLLGLLLLALPAAAQSPPGGAPQVATPASFPPPVGEALPRISAGHAAALGAGMFAGAMAGSVLIHGGGLAALIGAAAGLAIGHWAWTEHGDDTD
jgi:hypothetical protein